MQPVESIGRLLSDSRVLIAIFGSLGTALVCLSVLCAILCLRHCRTRRAKPDPLAVDPDEKELAAMSLSEMVRVLEASPLGLQGDRQADLQAELQPDFSQLSPPRDLAISPTGLVTEGCTLPEFTTTPGAVQTVAPAVAATPEEWPTGTLERRNVCRPQSPSSTARKQRLQQRRPPSPDLRVIKTYYL